MRALPKRIIIASERDGLDETFAMLRGKGALATDTETTGLDWRTEIVGAICLAANDTAIFLHKNALAPAARYLADQITAKRSFAFHHAKFDLHMLRESFGLHFPYPVHDTWVQSRLIDNRGAADHASRGFHGEHGLKPLARRFVNPDAKEPSEQLMAAIKVAGGKGMEDWLLAPRKLYAKYGALDAWDTLQLHNLFMERIRAWPSPEGYPSLLSLYRTEQWMILALRDMEERGIKARRSYLERWQRTLRKDIEKSYAILLEYAGKEINWNSPPQLRTLLYEDLDLSTERRTGTGAMSTDKVALVDLKHPIGAALLHYRKINHACNVGARSILDAIGDDGAVHCNFNQIIDTGRMSCDTPNLQGQDRTSGVRRGFRPRKGLVFRMADYSQVEMRLAAHFANERTLVRGFCKGGIAFDVHDATGQRMFGVKKPTPNQRKYAKDVNFATIYGAGEAKQAEMLMTRVTVPEAMQACRDMGRRVTRHESPHRVLVSMLRERYEEMMPAMRRSARDEAKIAEQRGFVTNAYGRIRYLEADDSYKAFNTKIQGTAADAAKRGLVNVYKELQLGSGELAMLLQIHDEIIYESEGDPRTDKRVLELLAEHDMFRIPIIADLKGSTVSWQDKESIKL